VEESLSGADAIKEVMVAIRASYNRNRTSFDFER